MPRLWEVKVYLFRNCLYTFYCLPFKYPFKVRSIMSHFFSILSCYTVDSAVKLASDIFMEVSKKISPQALKVCALWNYFYFFYSHSQSTFYTKLHYTIFMVLERDLLWLLGLNDFSMDLVIFFHSFFNAQKPLTF